MKIIIIDYGAGNATNVKNALNQLGIQSIISDDIYVWKNADALIFPGVGSFGAAMQTLGNRTAILKDIITTKQIPFLGICLGMQLLMENSAESPGTPGLGIIKGIVKKFNTKLPVPQIGWNKVNTNDSPLFQGINRIYAYFVHSYHCIPNDQSCISATTNYGIEFASAFTKGNIYATQFHPEKSGETGLLILKNFIDGVKK